MPITPYIISGNVYEVNGTASSGTRINVLNTQTGQQLSTLTNANGEYILDLANMSTSYTNGDRLFIKAIKPKNSTNMLYKEASAEAVVDTTTGATMQNLTLMTEIDRNNTSGLSLQEISQVEHDTISNTKKVLTYGTTGTQFLPLKVSDDGSGLGKLVTTVD